ncbi:MAG TPA: transcriptional repressor LexA [Dehalococcoidia bacterium]|nr:transcriptional repressor LexA [Dehalococcoidia bacterium]
MKIYTTRWRIVEFIRNFVEERGYAPTIGEIQKALGISSKSVVKYHLSALEEEGLITREPEVARGIEVSGVGRRARAVPLLGTIAAGEPIPVPTEETWHSVAHAQETIEVPAEMLSRQARAYALRVKGTSMIDALVDDGDVVVLEATRVAEDGEMVAAWLPERQEATLKKLYREPGRIRLQPANRSMAPLYVRPHEVQVQGRVIGVLRKYSQGSPNK